MWSGDRKDAALTSGGRLTLPGEPIRCSVNVSFVFGESLLQGALLSAAEAGFRTVELLDPYRHPAATIRRWLDELGLGVDLMNAPMGDHAGGERGIAGDPGRKAAYQASLDLLAEYAEVLRPSKANVLAGRAVDGMERRAQLECLRANLAAAADRLHRLDVRVVTELLNPLDTPGFLLADLETVASVLDELDGCVGFQLDVFHLQRSRGNLIPSIRAMAPYTDHVQVADAPGRTEPGTGEINVVNVLRAIRETGYGGLVGLEYRPTRRSNPFAWMAAAGCAPG